MILYGLILGLLLIFVGLLLICLSNAATEKDIEVTETSGMIVTESGELIETTTAIFKQSI
jgi:uncharacterized membrane protein